MAVRGMVLSTQKALKDTGMSWSDIDWFVPHQANLRINDKVAEVAEIPGDKVLNSIQRSLPPQQRAQVAQITSFAQLARQNLALADNLLSSIRQPIAVDKRVIAGSVPPLDTFAVAVAAAVTLLFVTVLLVSGSLALEREENTFTRITRGPVSQEGLLAEKALLGTGAALVVTLLLLLAITPFESIGWSRIYLIVPAILLAGAASSAAPGRSSAPASLEDDSIPRSREPLAAGGPGADAPPSEAGTRPSRPRAQRSGRRSAGAAGPRSRPGPEATRQP